MKTDGKVKNGRIIKKSSLTLRRSFHSPSPSWACVAVSNVSSIARTDVQDQ